MRKLEDLKVGDIVNDFEVIKLLSKNTQGIQRYMFRCIHCGQILKSSAVNIKRRHCNGCKVYTDTKLLYESLKDKVIKGNRCIGYDLKLSSRNYMMGILIFECVKCKNTIKLPASCYKVLLKYCSCAPRIEFYAYNDDKEEVGDFIITKTTKHISNSHNIKYIATCKYCGHTIQNQHSAVVKLAKEGCKHHVCVNGEYIKKSEYNKIRQEEIEDKRIKREISKRKVAETALDKIYKDFKLYEKIHDRLEDELFNLDNDPKTKKKYEDIIKYMAKALLRWCE